ncbi:accessory gene regulator B family protein [Oscillospiraceae bacterium HCP3S3_F4]
MLWLNCRSRFFYRLKNVYSSLLFLYIFFFLRLFSGGYHAPTYSK